MKSDHTANTSTSVSPSPAAIDVLTKRLIQSDSTISTLRAEVRVLQGMVEKLNSENNELRTRLSQTNSEVNSVSAGLNLVGQSNGSNGLDINSFVAQVSYNIAYDAGFLKSDVPHESKQTISTLPPRVALLLCVST